MARKQKAKPKAKRKPPDRRPQSVRFKEAAKMVEADESGQQFEATFKKIVRTKVEP